METTDPAAAATPDEPKEKRVKRRLMYLHSFQDNGRTLYRWGFVKDDWNAGDNIPDFLTDMLASYWGKLQYWHSEEQLSRSPSPGQVFEFEFSEDGKSIFIPGKKGRAFYIGWASVETKLLMYCHSRDRENAAQAMATKEGKLADVLEFMEPVRDLYAKLPAPRRSQLLAMIVQYLHTQPSLKKSSDDEE